MYMVRIALADGVCYWWGDFAKKKIGAFLALIFQRSCLNLGEIRQRHGTLDLCIVLYVTLTGCSVANKSIEWETV